jgi:uncharacterized protein YprB with RNaseH-like and TPR domain
MLSLKGKLHRFKQHLTVDKEAKVAGSTVHHDVSISDTPAVSISAVAEKKLLAHGQIPYLDQWEGLQASPYFLDSDYALRREIHYPLDHMHGRYSFSKLQEVVEAWNTKKRSHPLSSYQYQEKDLLFFDTETTGLGGGVGNTIFLLGYAKMTEKHLQVTQLFLPSPASEVALYHGFLEDIKDMERLVTYNGKAFDWPQVKTRHTLIREELPKLPSFGHFDLLHASRRLWKNELPSCRLSIIEEHIIDFKRTNDTPGYLAPILYFEYLQSMDPSNISGVLQHNEWDVCSLVTLYTHISLLLLDLDESSLSTRESLEIGRWYEGIGELDLAIHHFKKAIMQGGAENMLAKHWLAYVYKKRKEYSLATQLWEEVSHRHQWTIEADIELAKLYEHHYKDFQKALHFASKAFQSWNSARRLANGEKDKSQRNDFMKRIQRLQKKISGDLVEQDTLF